MSRGGGWRLVLGLVLGLAISGFSFVATASAVPVIGGPSIRDVTVDNNGTLGNANDDVIYVAFDNGLLGGSVVVADFVSTGTSLFDGGTASAVPGGFGSMLVTLTNLAREVTATDSIALSARGVVTSAFPAAAQVASHDVTPHNINTGPILVNATASGLLTDSPTDDVLSLVFNVPVEGDAGGAVDIDDFILGPLSGGETIPIGDDDGDNLITIALNDAIAPFSGKMRPSASVVRINTVVGATGPLRSVTNDVAASSQAPIKIANSSSFGGAFIIDATYNPRGAGTGNDELLLVFSEDLEPVTDNPPVIGDFTTGDLFTVGSLAFNGSELVTVNANVARISMDAGSTPPTDGGPESVDMLFANNTWNRAGLLSVITGGTAIDGAGAGLDKGPIILSATAVPNGVGGTDLTIQFSEGVLDATVGSNDFQINDEAAGTGITGVGTGAVINDATFLIQLSAPWNDLSDGSYIQLVALGIQSNEGSAASNASTVRHPIRDGRRPTTPPISLIVGAPNTYEENPGGGVSIAHLAWTESAGTDSADYYLIFSRVADPVDSQYVADNLFRALPVLDPSNRIVGSGPIVGDRIITASLDITPGMETTEGTTIVAGDPITFGIVAVTCDNRPAPINASGSNGGLQVPVVMTAGEVGPPIDFLAGVDDNMIHIIGHKSTTPDSVAGDSASVEANARVLAFVSNAITLADTADTSVFIGFGQADGVGQVPPFDIGDDHQDPLTGFIYLFTLDQFGNLSGSSLAIYNDNDKTGLASAIDPYTPNKIYADGDSIVIFATFRDTIFAATPVLSVPDPASIVVADFSQIDTAPGNENIPFENHGADGVDNDEDWQATDVLAAADPGDADFLSDDVGLDGIAGTTDTGEGDATPTPGEYFCDVGGPSGVGAGNGAFDPGEPFTDVNGNHLRDPGEPDIDLADADEYGLYVARLPEIMEATSVTDSGQANFLDIKNLPVVIMTTDCFENMTLMDGTDPFNRFLIELDNLAPSVSEILDFERESSLASDDDNDVVNPGQNCYPMGEFIDFSISTPSDLDVDFARLQISVNGGPWFDMSYDPNGDANGDGYPGEQDVDDDRDGIADSADVEVLAAIDQVNGGAPAFDGVDNDNDGMIDESITNALDDDGDGTVDEGDEVETYNATFDDNEDGIEDGVDTGAGRAENPQPHVLDPSGLGVAETAIDFKNTNGFNLDMTHIRNLYGITDADQLRLRAVAYDLAGGPYYGPNFENGQGGSPFSIIANDQTGFNPTGNATPEYAAPICFTTNLEAPVSTLSPAAFSDIDAGTAGVQICDASENFQGGSGGNVDETAQIPAVADTVTVEAAASGDAVQIEFFVWDGSTSSFVSIGTDVSGPPFTTDWSPGLVDNDPADRVNHFYLTTQATDGNGNVEELDRNGDTFVDSLDAQVDVFVVDCVAPIANVTRIWTDTDLTNGASVPIQDAVEIEIADVAAPGYTGFSDRDEIQMFNDGADNDPGVSGVNDDGDGSTDERDFGFDGIPGTSDDEWGNGDDVAFGYIARAGLGLDRGPGDRTVDDDGLNGTDNPDYGDDGAAGTADDEFLRPGTDDFLTNDVIRVDFQMRPVGLGGPWTTIGSITGTIVGGNVSDLITPLVVTWDVTGLAPGDYDVRAQAFDIEGNTNDGTAFVTTVKVNPIGLRAYIIEPEPAGPPAGLYTLYAHTYIHDTFVDHVDFQFYQDDDGNGSDDDGNNWLYIATDDTDLGGSGGDVLLRQGTAPFSPNISGGSFIAFTADVKFVDLDGDGYSSRDPIINDANFSGDVDGGDFAMIGDISDVFGQPLVPFPADHFYVGGAGVDESDWIYQENVNGGVFDLWSVGWDARGLTGSVLVRAVATNELGAVDDTTTVEPGVIPVESVDIDASAPCAEISGITLQDGTFVPPSGDTLDVNADNSFISVTATTTDADVASVEFQWSSNGGATWNSGSAYFDVNEDGDFYADIDGTPGFSSGDEIFFDADGNFSYSAADVVTRKFTTNPVTPLGFELRPLLGEDPSTSFGNDDDDNQTDEDEVSSTDVVAAYTAFFDLTAAADAGLFATDTQILLRAIATDEDGNVCGTTTFFKALVHERRSCEVDAIVVTTTDGDTADVLAELSDGDGTDQFGSDTLTVFATAEDPTTITGLSIFYRKHPNSYPGLNVFNNPWVATGVSDATYPYFMTWDLTAIPDGCYQFYIGCSDAGGNVNSAPATPYEFQKLTVTASVTVPESVITVFPGDELLLRAELSDPAATANAEVTFRYAERILDEVVTLTQSFPYQFVLSQTATPDPDGTHTTTVDVTINGTPATYHTPDDFDALAAPTLSDFTIVSNSTLRMGGQQTANDVILVSYNVTDYSLVLLSGDREAPFTAAWDFRTGGVPTPTVDGVDAFDLIASLSYNFFDPFFTPTPPTAGACLFEEDLSEGRYILVLNSQGPCTFVHGVHRDKEDESYPFDFNAPGNPMCLTGDKQETGLSGKEIDVFVTVTDSAEAGIDSVYGFVDGEATRYDFALYSLSDTVAANDSISLPITMYVDDYQFIPNTDGVVLNPERVENVTLRYTPSSVFDTETSLALVMYDDGANGGDLVADDGCYTATPRLALDSDYRYQFDIDLVGDEQYFLNVADARNHGNAPLLLSTSRIQTPEEFWYFHFDVGVDGALTDGSHSIVVWAMDSNGNRRSNVQCPQGRLMFISDMTAPVISMIDITPDVLGIDDESCTEFIASVMIQPNPVSIPAIGVSEVQWQFSPDNGFRWIVLGDDDSASEGWHIDDSWDWDPLDDGIDNDGDGYFDEGDNLGDGASEAQATFLLRALAIDDCGNIGYSAEIPFQVDGQEPSCELTSPADGSLFAYGSSFEICATSPDQGHLASIKFQYMDVGGVWINIDPTPQDDTDDDFVTGSAANASEVCVTFDTDVVDLAGTNPLLWIRCVAADSACNEESDPEPRLVQLYDASAPSAWVSGFNNDCGPTAAWDAHLAVDGDDVEIFGVVVDPVNTTDVAKVTAQIDIGGTFQDIGTDFAPFTGFGGGATDTFVVDWDTTPLADGPYTIRVVATDTNGNSDTSAVTYSVRVDHTDPTTPYTNIAFIDTTVSYDNDHIVDHSSLVVQADEFTGDVIFRVITPDADIKSMVLQYRLDDPTTPGDWQTLDCGVNLQGEQECAFDFESNRSSTGAYFWWLVIPDWAQTIGLADGQYQFRAVATDYACNTNALSTDFVAVTVDTGKPFCMFFGNDAVADGTIGNVAAGETVTINSETSDSETDVTNVWYDYQLEGETEWTRIPGEDLFTVNNLDTDHASWSSSIEWETPHYVVRDKIATIRAHVYDSANDTAICVQSILVEDTAPPLNTRIFDITSNNGECDVFPRDVTETTLMAPEGTTVAQAVNITAATAVGDSGIAEVHFEVSSDNGATWIEIGVDQDPGTFTNQFGMSMPIWTVTWDTEALDTDGNRRTPDGDYLLRAWAKDLEENFEILTATAPMRAEIHVDNENPTVRMATLNGTAFDESPQVCETTIERGSVVHVSGETIVSPTNSTITTDEDVTVTFYYMNAKDEPWVPEAWKVMDRANGINFFPDRFAPDNPDSNRPYGFEWNTALDSLPLTVGGTYNVVAIGSDLVCNQGDVVQAWMAGLGTCFTVTDTTAPCGILVYLERHDATADFIQWPDWQRVNRIASIDATIRNGDTDTKRVDFYYRTYPGSTPWILADGDLAPLGGQFYTLNNWNSDNLPEGTYEFAANAIDDAGNADFDPSSATDAPCHVTRLIIDRTPPIVTAVAPVDSQMCSDQRYEYDQNEDVRTIDVVVTLDSNDFVLENNSENGSGGITFEWKFTSDPDLDSNWDDDGFGNVIFDRSSGRISTAFDVDEPGDDIVDFRVSVEDSAGNVTTQWIATWVVLDTNEPEVTITRIVNLRDDSTFEFDEDDLNVDISAGDPIRVWVTARDNGSVWVPSWASCGVDTVFFEISDGGPFMPLNVGSVTGADSGAFFVDWNTTGLSVGEYSIRAFGVDCCGNEGFSQNVTLEVKSDALPKVAVVCFDPDVLNDIYGRTTMTVYAREWCEQEVDKVIFEYREVTGGETGPWIPFGFTEEISDTDSLWASSLDLSTSGFAVGDRIQFRGIAITYAPGESSNRTILYTDPNPVVTEVTVEQNALGTRDLRFEMVRTDPELVNFSRVQLVPNSDDSWTIEVTTNSVVTIPWVTGVAENDGNQEQWEETIRLYRSVDNNLVWRGGATKSVIDALCDGGTISFCAAAIDSAVGRVDIDDWSTRAYKVTNEIGTNGTVRLTVDSTNAFDINIPPGNGANGAVVISPAVGPSIEEDQDQSLFLALVPDACYEIRFAECSDNETLGAKTDGAGAVSFLDCFGDPLTNSYPATVTIHYGDEWAQQLVVNPLGGEETVAQVNPAWESMIEPSYFDRGGNTFRNDHIFSVVRDTVANTITFKAHRFCSEFVYCLTYPKLTWPIEASVWPYCNGFTGDQPTIEGTMTDIFTQGNVGDHFGENIDSTRVRIWIDSDIWASTDIDEDFEDDDSNERVIGWARGNGHFEIRDVSPSNDIIAFKYTHSTLKDDQLAAGPHVLTLQFAAQNEGDGRWIERKINVEVDNKAPTVVMNSGFTGSPVLANSAGYVSASEPALTARMWDFESGVFARPNHADPIMNVLFSNLLGGPLVITIPPFITGFDLTTLVITLGDIVLPINEDMGLKMDLWLVEGSEDDQDDIDEFFERNLIQTGTPDMLRYTPPLQVSNSDSSNYYTPDDTLTVRFPVVADLAQYDGREIEVVLYTAKVEHIGHDIQNPEPSDSDEGEGEEFTKYLLGPFDCAGNVASNYVAARYIVDASAPRVAVAAPICNSKIQQGDSVLVVIAVSDQGGAPDIDNDNDGRFAEDPIDGLDNDGDWIGRTTDPLGNVIYVDDTNRNGRADAGEPHVDEDPDDSRTFTGAGIDTTEGNAPVVTVTGPDGFHREYIATGRNIQDGQIRFTVSSETTAALAVGQYTITVTGRDLLGNTFSTTCNFEVENAVLEVLAARAYPNPFDPSIGNATITWDQSREGTVTIELYDFAGDFVGRLRDNARITAGEASSGVQWGGTDENGRGLANGGYIAHIIVNDGARTQSTDVKIAIRRD